MNWKTRFNLEKNDRYRCNCVAVVNFLSIKRLFAPIFSALLLSHQSNFISCSWFLLDKIANHSTSVLFSKMNCSNKLLFLCGNTQEKRKKNKIMMEMMRLKIWLLSEDDAQAITKGTASCSFMSFPFELFIQTKNMYNDKTSKCHFVRGCWFKFIIRNDIWNAVSTIFWVKIGVF